MPSSEHADLAMGGQAVIEGVMMRDKTHYAVAVRKKNGKIAKKITKINSVTKKYPVLGWPVLRGFVFLIENLVIGINALNYSIGESVGQKEKLGKKEMALTLLFSLALTILLFIAAPFFLTTLISKDKGLWFNLIDGIIRLVIFFIYLILISFMKDVKILFQYHGAEHKAVATYEHKKKLMPQNIVKYSRFHPRCGTSFLLIVMIVSILVFSLIVSDNLWIRLVSRIILIPVITGISYEVLKSSAKFQNNFIMKIITLPGVLLQHITTREPSKQQIEVAIEAINMIVKNK